MTKWYEKMTMAELMLRGKQIPANQELRKTNEAGQDTH